MNVPIENENGTNMIHTSQLIVGDEQSGVLIGLGNLGFKCW